MVTRSNVKLGLTGAILLMIFGAFSGCTESSPTGIDDTSPRAPTCVVIDGVVYCSPG